MAHNTSTQQQRHYTAIMMRGADDHLSNDHLINPRNQFEEMDDTVLSTNKHNDPIELDFTVPNPNLLYRDESDRLIGRDKKRPFTATLAAAMKGRYPHVVLANMVKNHPTKPSTTTHPRVPYDHHSPSVADESLYTHDSSWIDYSYKEVVKDPLLVMSMSLVDEYEYDDDDEEEVQSNSSYTEVTVSTTSEITTEPSSVHQQPTWIVSPPRSNSAEQPVPDSDPGVDRAWENPKQLHHQNDNQHEQQHVSEVAMTATSTISSHNQPWTDTLTMDLLLQSNGGKKSEPSASTSDSSPISGAEHPVPRERLESPGRRLHAAAEATASREVIMSNGAIRGNPDDRECSSVASNATSRAVAATISAAHAFQCPKTNANDAVVPPEWIYHFSGLPSNYYNNEYEYDDNHTVVSTLTKDESPHDLVEQAILELMSHPPDEVDSDYTSLLREWTTRHANWIQRIGALSRQHFFSR